MWRIISRRPVRTTDVRYHSGRCPLRRLRIRFQVRQSVAFIIPVHNDAERLAACLASLPRDGAVEVVVVDHGSVDASRRVASDKGARVLALARSVPNVASLRNQGARAVSSELVAFVDADHTLDPGWLAAARVAVTPPDVGAVGAQYHGPAEGTWVQRWYDGFRDHSAVPGLAAWLGAGNLVVRREAFVAVGGFDESLESCEDVDLCFRLREAGWSVVNEPGMRSTHHGDPATLSRLYRSELWRGRDNMRVSLRERPLSLRNTLSALTPVAQLGAFVLALAGVAGAMSGSRAGQAVAAAAAVVILVPLLARALLMWRRTQGRAPYGLAGALVVATTYDVARALALVSRATHHRPRAAASATTNSHNPVA